MLEQVTSKVMFECFELEDEPGGKQIKWYKDLASKFGLCRITSNAVDIVSLCAGVAHGSFLAAGLMGASCFLANDISLSHRYIC